MHSNDVIKFGLIGCGRVAPRHATAIKKLKNAKLVAVADIIDSRALLFADKYEATAYNNYQEIIENDSIDVVSICTPSGLHKQMAIEAMYAGKHVIVEKPMALSLADADKMIEIAESTNLKLCVVLQNRYNPPIAKLRNLVDEGKLGKLLLGNATVRWYRPQTYYEDSWHGKWAMDGGALLNQSIHHIDVLQWFMGDVSEVFAYTATLAHSIETEDTGVSVMRFSNGTLGVVEGSTITYPKNIEGSLAIFGERGSVKIGGTHLNRQIIWDVVGIEGKIYESTKQPLSNESVYGDSHKAVIADMIDSILSDRQPKTNGIEARQSLSLVLAMYESSRIGKTIDMTKNQWCK